MLVMCFLSYKLRRFKWPEHPQIKFSPAVGHLLAGASKRITATFQSATPLKLEGQDLKLQVVQIQHKGPPADWDDVLAAAAAAAAPPAPAVTLTPRGVAAAASRAAGAVGKGGARGSQAGAAAAAAAAAAPGGEPLHDVVPKTQRDMPLKVGLGSTGCKLACTSGSSALESFSRQHLACCSILSPKPTQCPAADQACA